MNIYINDMKITEITDLAKFRDDCILILKNKNLVGAEQFRRVTICNLQRLGQDKTRPIAITEKQKEVAKCL